MKHTTVFETSSRGRIRQSLNGSPLTFGEISTPVVLSAWLTRALRGDVNIQDELAIVKRITVELESQGPAPPQPAGHMVDERLLAMLRHNASSENPKDGFATALKSNIHSSQVEGIAVIAWGPSAAILAKTLGIGPGNDPDAGPQTLSSDDARSLEAPERPKLPPAKN